MNKNEVHLEIPHAQMTKQVLANKKVAKAFKSPSKHKIELPDHWFGSKNIILRLFQLIMPL